MSEWLNKLADRMMEFLWPLFVLTVLPPLCGVGAILTYVRDHYVVSFFGSFMCLT